MASRLLPALALLFALKCVAQNTSDIRQTIFKNAAADDIDLSAVNFTERALSDIESIYNTEGSLNKPGNGSRIDVHVHLDPDWFREIQPIYADIVDPTWNISLALEFMESEDIAKSVLSFTVGAATVYPGNQSRIAALTRLMNEQMAAYARTIPDRFCFFAAMPFPYINESIKEAQYALDQLGACGIGLMSSSQGQYLGNPDLRPFYVWLNERSGRQVIFTHPFMNVDGKLVEANPTLYPYARVDFYFETARAFYDLTLTQTLHNFTNIDWILPHAGDSFPSVMDRILGGSTDSFANATYEIFRTRLWYDTAGPVMYHQVGGLLAYGVPDSHLLFGSDFPFRTLGGTAASDLQQLLDSVWVDAAAKTAIFSTNVEALLGKRLSCGCSAPH